MVLLIQKEGVRNTPKERKRTMFEFTVKNYKTNEEDIIFGYSMADAMRRNKMSPVEWSVISMNYAD